MYTYLFAAKRVQKTEEKIVFIYFYYRNINDNDIIIYYRCNDVGSASSTFIESNLYKFEWEFGFGRPTLKWNAERTYAHALTSHSCSDADKNAIICE